MAKKMNRNLDYDIFISYRRDGGLFFANSLFQNLKSNYNVFMDLEELSAGNFDENLTRIINNCNDFILVVTPGALRTTAEIEELKKANGGVEPEDWVKKEILQALSRTKLASENKAKPINIIPVFQSEHPLPAAKDLPEDIREIVSMNAVPFSNIGFSASMDKIASKFLLSRPVKHYRSRVPVILLLLIILALSAILFIRSKNTAVTVEPPQATAISETSSQIMTEDTAAVQNTGKSSLVLDIGSLGQYRSINDALNAVDVRDADVTLQLSEDLIQKEDIYIPTDKEIHSVTIRAAKDTPSVRIEGNGTRLFANGISLCLQKNVRLDDLIVFGGSLAKDGDKAAVDNVDISILGDAYIIYAGGKADGKDSHSEVQQADITISGSAAGVFGGGVATEGGNSASVDTCVISILGRSDEVSGGGLAVGLESSSDVNSVEINIRGTVGTVYGGGSANSGAAVNITDTVAILVDDAASVEDQLIYGGSAQGRASSAVVQNISVSLPDDFANEINKKGSASDNGSVKVENISENTSK